MNKDKTISVIIPTYKRINKLLSLLSDLNLQTYPFDNFEVIVIDDGSPEDFSEIFSNLKLKYTFKYIKITNSGPAIARNKAVQSARNEYLLFLNDDAKADPNLVNAHIETHLSLPEPSAIMGTFYFTEEIRKDPFCKSIEDLNLVITTKHFTPNSFHNMSLWSGNLSLLKDAFLAVGGFDTEFKEPSHEDVDLGIRLKEQFGMPFYYTKEAICTHDHLYDITKWRQHHEMGGRATFRVYHKFNKPFPNDVAENGVVNINKSKEKNLLCKEVKHTMDKIELALHAALYENKVILNEPLLLQYGNSQIDLSQASLKEITEVSLKTLRYFDQLYGLTSSILNHYT